MTKDEAQSRASRDRWTSYEAVMVTGKKAKTAVANLAHGLWLFGALMPGSPEIMCADRSSIRSDSIGRTSNTAP
jgi:hypothetical protein